MGLGNWGCLGVILYLCRNILYVLFWAAVALVCYFILQIL